MAPIKVTIEQIKELAISNNGESLMEDMSTYKNCVTPIPWKCKESHIFNATYTSVQRGSWCPICEYDSRRIKLEDIQGDLDSKNVKFDSSNGQEFKGCAAVSKWECTICNYKWESNYDTLRKRESCPKCAINKKKVPLERIKQKAEENGGESLLQNMSEYKNSRTPIPWKCKTHGQFMMMWNTVQQGGWCSKCGNKKDKGKSTGSYTRLTINDAHTAATEKGGKCLFPEDQKFEGGNTNIKWECSLKHTWNALFKSIRDGTWCPECAKIKKRIPLERIHELAKERGGVSLITSQEQYKNSELKIPWKCGENHEFELRLNDLINNGRWCPVCSKINNTISDKTLQEYAATKEGNFIGKTETKYGAWFGIWECKFEHRWEAKLSCIMLGRSWCPDCGINSTKIPIDQYHKLAESKQVKCLINEILPGHTSETFIKWECHLGHVWKTSYSSIYSRGSWCQICGEFKGEREVRIYLENNNYEHEREYMFDGCKYKNKLRFDFFVPDLNVLIEFDGEAHYNSVEFYGGDEGLEIRQIRDKIKNDYCVKNKISLIRISYLEESDIPKILDEMFSLIKATDFYSTPLTPTNRGIRRKFLHILRDHSNGPDLPLLTFWINK